ncbi:hypothetical protein CYL31_12955 [Marinomonas sp. A3A]|uniref:hypothetical protein n=1 Tax=Marinomonas sp. A3A TaxID=2065312 RepID=UPI001BB3DF4D|nr:hypothetical protein [Marinomonas sp. A3A]QUX92253.1 hypothetical protein CYL31_12955 [Marinomonas sp. A3A]
MSNEFYLSVHNQNRWKLTDEEGQHLLVKAMIDKCNDLSVGKINKVTSGFMTNNSEAEIVNSLLTGLSIPALVTSVGYLLKHLSPLLIQYMKNQSAKEITVDIHGIRITVKGGYNFEKELEAIIRQAEKLDGSNEDA